MRSSWRPWLRAIHRDIGYLAIGFTVIYAVSGIAQNHIADWGDVSTKPVVHVFAMAPIAASVPDAAAIQRVAAAAHLGPPATALRAGDEIRLGYADGTQVAAVGTQVTVQGRERRTLIGLANWLHVARGKKAWKYLADGYALFLLYLAGSGIFMIKGRMGLRWRGAIGIAIGVAVPVLYVVLAGGPERQTTQSPEAVAAAQTEAMRRNAAATPNAAAPPNAAVPPNAAAPATTPPGLRPLPPDDDE